MFVLGSWFFNFEIVLGVFVGLLDCLFLCNIFFDGKFFYVVNVFVGVGFFMC